MATLIVIAEGAGGLDAAAREALQAGGLFVHATAPPGDLSRLVDRADALLVNVGGGLKTGLGRSRDARALAPLANACAIIAIDRREAAQFVAGRGADDFIARPLDPQELLARVRALLWRTKRTSSDGVVRVGADLVIDTARYEVTVAGRRVDLTLKEYELLLFLARHPGRVFTRDVLLDRIWGQHYFGGTRTVDVHVRRVRMKIERGGRIYVDTVRGVGYRFDG